MSSRGGYLPGTPQHGRDHLVPHLETTLGAELGLDLEFITPSFGLAPVVPQLAHLRDQHEESLTEAHERARRLGESCRAGPGRLTIRDLGP